MKVAFFVSSVPSLSRVNPLPPDLYSPQRRCYPLWERVYPRRGQCRLTDQSARLAVGNQGAHAAVGENLQQHRIRHAAIDDVRAVHSALHRIQRALDLR